MPYGRQAELGCDEVSSGLAREGSVRVGSLGFRVQSIGFRDGEMEGYLGFSADSGMLVSISFEGEQSGAQGSGV